MKSRTGRSPRPPRGPKPNEKSQLDRRTMTFSLSGPDQRVLHILASHTGQSKTALVRQSLLVLLSLTERFRRGEKLFYEHPESKERIELDLNLILR